MIVQANILYGANTVFKKYNWICKYCFLVFLIQEDNNYVLIYL